MEYKLIIDGTLPNLNDYITKINVSKYRGNELKRDTEKFISMFIKKQLQGVKITRPVTLDYKWVEPDKVRDLDNICSFGMKTIQDALVKNGVLQNDGQKYVTGFTHLFETDRDNPRVEVTITEREI